MRDPFPWAAAAFAPLALDTLAAKGNIVLQGVKGSQRIVFVHGKALQGLAQNKDAALDLAAAYGRLKSDRPVSDQNPPLFRALAGLPSTGLMTPALHSLLKVLSAHHDNWTMLSNAGGAPGKEVVAAPNLFTTPCGAAFAASTHADVGENPASLVKPFFDFCLGGPHPDPQAATHLTKYISARYQIDLTQRLAGALAAGGPTEEVVPWITKYLTDQKHLLALANAKVTVTTLDNKSSLSADLKDLEAAAGAFQKKPSLAWEFDRVVARAVAAPAAGPLKITSGGIHLQRPSKLGAFELGDMVTISGAYWVDGLPDDKPVEVEETVFIETPFRAEGVEAKVQRRSNGGPYTFVREVTLRDSNQVVMHAVVSAAGSNIMSESLTVPVSRDFETALIQFASAEEQAQFCAFKEAETAYGNLEKKIEDAAKVKPQYAGLLGASRERRAAAVKHGDVLAKLKKAMSDSRADATVQACRYETKATDAAISLAKSLPAGCDRFLASLQAQRQYIERRAVNQTAFARKHSSARSHMDGCRFDEAVKDWNEGLAILSADPAARCGATAGMAGEAENLLPSVMADGLWRKRFDTELQNAEGALSTRTAAGIIAGMRAINTRISTLNRPSCFSKQRDRAEKLASQAEAALKGPVVYPQEFMAADPGLQATFSRVTAERRKVQDAMMTIQRFESDEAGPVAAPAPAAAAAPPAQPEASSPAPPSAAAPPPPPPSPPAPSALPAPAVPAPSAYPQAAGQPRPAAAIPIQPAPAVPTQARVYAPAVQARPAVAAPVRTGGASPQQRPTATAPGRPAGSQQTNP